MRRQRNSLRDKLSRTTACTDELRCSPSETRQIPPTWPVSWLTTRPGGGAGSSWRGADPLCQQCVAAPKSAAGSVRVVWLASWTSTESSAVRGPEARSTAAEVAAAAASARTTTGRMPESSQPPVGRPDLGLAPLVRLAERARSGQAHAPSFGTAQTAEQLQALVDSLPRRLSELRRGLHPTVLNRFAHFTDEVQDNGPWRVLTDETGENFAA